MKRRSTVTEIVAAVSVSSEAMIQLYVNLIQPIIAWTVKDLIWPTHFSLTIIFLLLQV